MCKTTQQDVESFCVHCMVSLSETNLECARRDSASPRLATGKRFRFDGTSLTVLVPLATQAVVLLSRYINKPHQSAVCLLCARRDSASPRLATGKRFRFDGTSLTVLVPLATQAVVLLSRYINKPHQSAVCLLCARRDSNPQPRG